MIPVVGDVVEFPLKIERVAKRGKTQTVSKKKAIVKAMGKVVRGPLNSMMSIELLACKKVRGQKWAPCQSLTFVEVLADEVEA